MFQFTGLLSIKLFIQYAVPTHYHRWVPPFGHLRIKAYLQLPEAFRSLSRPSSSSNAKASTIRPYLFNHHFRYPNLMRFYSIKSIMICCSLQHITTLSSFQRTLLKELYSFKTKQNISYSTLFVRIFFFLHRKEVIHPHVLVGIPCYDFTPITCPTLNGPLLKG